jgi:hypothetical protein
MIPAGIAPLLQQLSADSCLQLSEAAKKSAATEKAQA